MYIMQSYDSLLQDILANGAWRTNKRTGIRTLSIAGASARYRINEYFPLVSRRKIAYKSIFAELLWIISGSTNNNDLKKLGTNIWTPWQSKEFEEKHGYEEGELGPIYGYQLRSWNGDYPKKDGTDQLLYLINRIKEDSSCRRILVNLWNLDYIHKGVLAPCHLLFQVHIDDEDRMSGVLYSRSTDVPVGAVWNVAFYTTLLYIISQQTGFKPYELVHCMGDSHIYENQIEAVKEYLQSPMQDSPKLEVNPREDIFSYQIEDFVVKDYSPGKGLKIPVAV